MSLTVDLTSRMPEVMDQGARPTCLACAVSDAHQHLYAEVDALSVEALFHGCVERDPASLHSGATLACVKGALADTGQPDEASWPYEMVQPVLDTWRDPSPQAPRFRGSIIPIEPNFDGVAGILALEQPVVLALRVRDTLLFAGAHASLEEDCGGVIRGVHAVLGVGLAGVPTRSIRIRNSWGTSWGDAGHAQIGRGYFAANVVLAAVVENREAAND